MQAPAARGCATVPWDLMGTCIPAHAWAEGFQELQWQLGFVAKLGFLFQHIAAKFCPDNFCLCQAWLGLNEAQPAVPTNQTQAQPPGLQQQTPATQADVVLYAEPNLVILGDQHFTDLRNKSCQGPVGFRNSMPGKVYRTGAVQVIQNMRIIPPSLHPRSVIADPEMDRLAESLYVPVYDLSRPARGPVCVIEVLCSVKAPESMLVPDFISFVSNVLTLLQLSLSNPIPQPIKRSVLSGRRARPASSDADMIGSQHAMAEAAGTSNATSAAAPSSVTGGVAPAGGVYAAAGMQQGQVAHNPAAAAWPHGMGAHPSGTGSYPGMQHAVPDLNAVQAAPYCLVQSQQQQGCSSMQAAARPLALQPAQPVCSGTSGIDAAPVAPTTSMPAPAQRAACSATTSAVHGPQDMPLSCHAAMHAAGLEPVCNHQPAAASTAVTEQEADGGAFFLSAIAADPDFIAALAASSSCCRLVCDQPMNASAQPGADAGGESAKMGPCMSQDTEASQGQASVQLSADTSPSARCKRSRAGPDDDQAFVGVTRPVCKDTAIEGVSESGPGPDALGPFLATAVVTGELSGAPAGSKRARTVVENV